MTVLSQLDSLGQLKISRYAIEHIKVEVSSNLGDGLKMTSSTYTIWDFHSLKGHYH